MLVIGTSADGSSGQRSFHIFRDTLPCNLLTPLDEFASLIASTVMLNSSCSLPGCCRPNPASVLRSTPIFDMYSPRGYCSIMCIGNASLPAGTGVCVVKHVPAFTASNAVG